MRICKKAYAKINLCLDVKGKREDGYHLVRMVMQTVNLYDKLEFCSNETGEIRLQTGKASLAGDRTNLIWKACERMREDWKSNWTKRFRWRQGWRAAVRMRQPPFWR